MMSIPMMSILTHMSTLAVLTPPAASEYIALIPGSIVALTALIVILLDVFHRQETSRDYIGYFSAIGLGVAMLACWGLWDTSHNAPVFFGMLYADRFGLFFAALSCLAGILTMIAAPRYLAANGMDRGEYYMLTLFGVLGMIFMANSADLLSMFIALEVMSIPIYTLAAFLRRDNRSAEAGLKYFILGAFSTGLMLYGIALIYGLTGSTNYEFIAAGIATIAASPDAMASSDMLLTFGVLLVVAGLAFKLAAFPFHIWTPDVYTGSPTPAVGFMATGVKAAAIAALLRILVVALYGEQVRGGFFGLGWTDLLFAMAAGSVVLGNLVAISQTNVKRMLAYSSIAHAGYILVGIVAANSRSAFFLYNDAVLFYILTYTVGTVGAFTALAYITRNGKSAETYDDLSGVGFKYPFVGLVLTICMLSSAGIPPTAGFLGKLYVFRAAVSVGAQTGEMAFIGLAVLAILTSVAGVYYYLKVIVHLYMKPLNENVEALPHRGAALALGVSAILALYLGILPDSAIRTAREAVVDMAGVPAEIVPHAETGKRLLEAQYPEPPKRISVTDR